MLARSVFIESSSKLLVTRPGIKARSSLILGRIRPLMLELLALEWQKFHIFELEYLWSKLLVTRPGIKARSSLILGRIRPLMLELLALEWQKFHIFELEYLWSKLANLVDRIIIKVGGNQRSHKILLEIEFQSHPSIDLWVTCPWAPEKNVMDTTSLSVLIRSSSNLQITRTGLKFWTSSVSGQNGVLVSEFNVTELRKSFPKTYIEWRKCCGHDNDFIFDWIIIKCTGNQNRCKILDESCFFF